LSSTPLHFTGSGNPGSLPPRCRKLYHCPSHNNILSQLSVKSGSPIFGELAHAHMIKSAFKPCLFLLNNLLLFYCKCGDINAARQLFDKMPKRNVISYNSLISGYTQMGFYDKAM
jgi:pentatricopeptide repeat protein